MIKLTKKEKKIGISESPIKREMIILPDCIKYFDLSDLEVIEIKNIKKSDFLIKQIKWNKHDAFTEDEIDLIWNHLRKNKTDVFAIYSTAFVFEENSYD